MKAPTVKTVVFLHGMWCRASVSHHFRAALFGQCDFHAPDLPEHNDNQDLKALKQISIADYAEFIHDYINNLPNQKDRELILIGHSMGGLIAQKVAAEREVEALILLNSVSPAGINLINIPSLYCARYAVWRSFFFKSVHRPKFKHSRYALFNQLSEKSAQQYHNTLVHDSGRCFFEMALWWLDRKQTTRIQKPFEGRTLIIACGKDRIIAPKIAEKIRKFYPQANYRLYPNNGHWIFDEPNDQYIINDTINWIEQLDAIPHHSLPNETQSNQAIEEVL